MFTEVSENEIFRNQLGDFVSNGAMGVDKLKEVNGQSGKALGVYFQFNAC